MIRTDGSPTIAWAPNTDADPGDTTDALTLTMSRIDIELLAEALDSHRYWQLSELQFRNDGYVRPPGSTDPAIAALIGRTETLEDELRLALK